VEIQNLLLLLGFRVRWSVERPEWRKIKKSSTATLEDCLNWMGEQLKNSQNAALSFDFRG